MLGEQFVGSSNLPRRVIVCVNGLSGKERGCMGDGKKSLKTPQRALPSTEHQPAYNALAPAFSRHRPKVGTLVMKMPS